MTRHDLANLVVRIFALWLGVIGVAGLSAVPSMAQAPGQPEPLLTAMALGVPLAVGVVLWLVAPRLSATVFHRSGDAAPFAITADGVPPLAAFVVGLVTLAGAVPQALSWLAMQAMRGRADASLMNTDLLPALDQQSVGTGAEIVARLIVGAVLIALSRRRGIWSTSDAAPTDASAEADE